MTGLIEDMTGGWGLGGLGGCCGFGSVVVGAGAGVGSTLTFRWNWRRSFWSSVCCSGEQCSGCSARYWRL